jgi:hypothetical protein
MLSNIKRTAGTVAYRAGSQSDCGAENLLCSTVGVGVKSTCCISSTRSGWSPMGASTGYATSSELTSVLGGVMEKVAWIGSGSPATWFCTACEGDFCWPISTQRVIGLRFEHLPVTCSACRMWPTIGQAVLHKRLLTACCLCLTSRACLSQ